MTNGSGLASVDHVVVLMLENRSFDHMLGFLYPGNVSPSGQPFDGLTGTVSHLESVRAELISRRYPAGVTTPQPPGLLSA